MPEWGVVKGFQIACNLAGPLGDLTGKSDQPSRKVVHRKGTRQVLDTAGGHPAPTGPIRKGTQGCLVWSIDGPRENGLEQVISQVGKWCW